MNEKENYIACPYCKEWTDIRRVTNICHTCNNSKLVRDPREVLCNNCGGTMCPIGTMNEIHPHGLHKAKVTGGFNSYHLFDMTRYTFSLCEKCLRELFNKFIIPPELNEFDVFDDSVGQTEPWYQDQKNYEYRIWCDDGGHHQAYLNKKCNEVKDCPNDATWTVLLNSDYSENCCCDIHKEKYNTAYPSSYKLVKFIPHTLKAFL